MVQADFAAATLTDVTFDGCDLRAAELSQVSCTRVDLRGARIEDVRGANALAGATVSPEQLVPLAPALAAAIGLTVRPVDEA
jgi:uncharacterized protein YjbI with pentapeptide repeats